MALDFSLLGQGPQFGNVLAAYDAGRQQRKQNDTTNALALYATDPEKGIQALTKVDPLLGMKLQDDFTERQQLAERKKALSLYEKDPEASRKAVMATADPKAMEIWSSMDKNARERAHEIADTVGGTAFAVMKAAPGDDPAAIAKRKEMLASQAPNLVAIGIPQAKVEEFVANPTMAALEAAIAGSKETLKLKIDQEGKDRDYELRRTGQEADDKRADLQLEESRRHNQASEGISAFSARDASARGWANVGVARAAEDRQQRAASQPNAGKPPTEDQAKTGFNAQRMIGASQTLNGLEAKGFNPTMVGIGSALARPESRQYDAAKREWSDGIIRLTTGAAATKQELEAVDKAYFPQFGDSSAVVRYKAQRRKAAEDSAAARASGQRQTPPSDGGYKVLKVR